MKTAQVEFKISLPEQVVNLLQSKADTLGVSMTQLVKKLILSDIKEDHYPKFKASKATIRAAKQAMKDYKAGKAIFASDFFKRLNNES